MKLSRRGFIGAVIAALGVGKLLPTKTSHGLTIESLESVYKDMWQSSFEPNVIITTRPIAEYIIHAQNCPSWRQGNYVKCACKSWRRDWSDIRLKFDPTRLPA